MAAQKSLLASLNFTTPLGPMRAVAGAAGLSSLVFSGGDYDTPPLQTNPFSGSRADAAALCTLPEIGERRCALHDYGDDAIAAHIDFGTEQAPANAEEAAKVRACLVSCFRELAEYFAGRLRGFTVALDLKGGDFRRRAWGALCDIPYGATVSYARQAAAVGNAKAARAVGAANRANPVAIIVPCHRVIASDGSLCGYAGGLWRKRYLIALERAASR